MPRITLGGPDEDHLGFGAFSGTTLITVRQRLNMNAVRLRVDAQELEGNEQLVARVRNIVREVNQFELLAILELDSTTSVSSERMSSIWYHCASELKAISNVFFALSPGQNAQPIVESIRAAGATQPIIVADAKAVIPDPNVIYEVSPSYSSIRTDLARADRMSSQMPVLVDGLDPKISLVGLECAAFPNDPGSASTLIDELLENFDEHSISWTISTLESGKLIDAFQGYDWTKLDEGWTCGGSSVYAGIGMLVLSHLWRADPHGVLTVNQPAGGMVIAKGAHASAYGRILAQREERAERAPWPFRLGDISIRVTDSHGVSRLAPLSWVGGGWSSINFLVPVNSATGPAQVTVMRSDGSHTASNFIIADVAPGLWSATSDGRGPAIGQVVQRFSNGKVAQFPTWNCSKGCRTISIPLTRRAATAVRIEGTGFRFTRSTASVHVIVDGIQVPVEGFGAIPGDSHDQVTIRLPNELRGRGEVDLWLTADGALSNVVRINCGQLNEE